MAEQRRYTAHWCSSLVSVSSPGQLAQVLGLRVWSQLALVKEPAGNPTGYHPDVRALSFSSPADADNDLACP